MRIEVHCVRHREEERIKAPIVAATTWRNKKTNDPPIFTLVEDSGLAAIELRNGNASQTQGDWRGRIHMVRTCRSPRLQN